MQRPNDSGGRPLVGDPEGNFRRVHTAGVDVTFTAWQGEDALLYAGHRSFETVAGLLEGADLATRELWTSEKLTFGDARYPSASPARVPGDFTTVLEGFFDRSVLALFKGGEPRAVRAFGPDEIVARVRASGTAAPYRWNAPDGLEIHGWLIKPHGEGPHPLVMDIHGGPVWAWRPRFLGRTGHSSLLFEAGYAIFLPNVRGASGRGQDCTICCTVGGPAPCRSTSSGSYPTTMTCAILSSGTACPTPNLPVTKSTKAEQEARFLAVLEDWQGELVVLARYMQVLSDEMCRELAGRCINIHHSFLPGFKGAKPYHQAHARGVKIICATAHYVTPDLDEGPIIEQAVERVDHSRSPDQLVEIGRDIESVVLSRAVRWHAENRVMLNGSSTIVFQ